MLKAPRRLSAEGDPCITISDYEHARLWDGSPQHETGAVFGR